MKSLEEVTKNPWDLSSRESGEKQEMHVSLMGLRGSQVI